jgi:hypothetical protein
VSTEIIFDSFCNPSRGPTSTIFTFLGIPENVEKPLLFKELNKIIDMCTIFFKVIILSQTPYISKSEDERPMAGCRG